MIPANHPINNTTAVYNDKNLGKFICLSQPWASILGFSLFTLTLAFVTFYIYVMFLIIGHRMWRTNSYFLWFISCGISDMMGLLLYLYGNLLFGAQTSFFARKVDLFLSNVYALCFFMALTHFPTMALVRLSSLSKPNWSKRFFNLKNSTIMIFATWCVVFVEASVFQSFPGTEMLLDYGVFTWSIPDLKKYIDGGFLTYFSARPCVCLILAIGFYICCLFELKK